jgi:Rrf2 family protein
MHVNLKTDYALRAALEVAARMEHSAPATRDEVSEAQNIPRRYLATILNDLRRAGLMTASRGPDGGYRLAKAPELISLADVIRAVDGPLTQVGGIRPENLNYSGSSANLGEVWLALRAAERKLLETTTLRDLLPDKGTGKSA